MPTINALGTYDQNSPGFEFLQGSLAYRNSFMTLLFAGTAPTTLTVEYQDDEDNWRLLSNGTIASLPATLELNNFSRPLRIIAAGGTPNFNVTAA